MKNFKERRREALKAENEFLKLKMMLEHGARFGPSGSDLDPEIENIFLNNIIAIEKQFEHPQTISVFDKIGRPAFKLVRDIPTHEILFEWQKLSAHMILNGVELHSKSDVNPRELYRFATEELMSVLIDDIKIPDFVCCFFYEDFFTIKGKKRLE